MRYSSLLKALLGKGYTVKTPNIDFGVKVVLSPYRMGVSIKSCIALRQQRITALRRRFGERYAGFAGRQ